MASGQMRGRCWSLPDLRVRAASGSWADRRRFLTNESRNCGAACAARHACLGQRGERLGSRCPDVLISEMVVTALCDPRGNSQVFGFFHRQYSRNVSSSRGHSGTSRSLPPLPFRMCTIMRLLSMSSIRNGLARFAARRWSKAALVRRAPGGYWRHRSTEPLPQD